MIGSRLLVTKKPTTIAARQRSLTVSSARQCSRAPPLRGLVMTTGWA